MLIFVTIVKNYRREKYRHIDGKYFWKITRQARPVADGHSTTFRLRGQILITAS